jgi:glycosyltransferase involved in cell wall biosynthesis
MKIFLVDFFVNGHHVEYAGYLGRYLLEQGHEVTFATWRPNDRVRVLSDIGLNLRYVADKQVALSSDTFYMIPQFKHGLRHCLQVATREGATIVHLLYLDRALLLPLWWNDLWSEFHIPIFGTLFSPYHFIDGSHLSPLKKLYHRVVRKTLKSLLVEGKLASLFVHTERIKECVLRALGTHCLEDRFVVVPDPIPDPIHVADQDASKQGCRARLALPLERIVLLFFGELREDKGPDVLLKAIHLLPPEVLVVFAGAPKGSLSLLDWEQEVRAQGLDGRVRLDLDHVPDELVSVYFQAADAIVLPYRRSFLATSGVLQRAAAAQKPVIATDVGEVGDLVRRHGLGLVVEPEDPQRLADAIGQYVRERETIKTKVTECASLYTSQNHWRQTAASVLAAYQRVLPGAY